MRAFALSALVSIAYGLFQSVDFFGVIDKYGFPTAVAVAMFLYFSRQINRKDAESNSYRADVLAEQKDQTTYLRSMLAEQRKAAVCHYLETQKAAELQKKDGGTEQLCQ